MYGNEGERARRWMRVLGSSDSGRSGDGRRLAEGSPRQPAPDAFANLCRRLPCRSVALFCLLLGALLLGSAPALAGSLSQRGHAFSFAFGSEGGGEGQFAHPSGIAVRDSTGDVYVADHFNNRVEEFKPKLSKGKVVGEEYVTSFPVPSPGSVAVDNSCYLNGKGKSEKEEKEAACTSPYQSNGDVYVVGTREVREEAELQEEAAELREEATQFKEEFERAQRSGGQTRQRSRETHGSRTEKKGRRSTGRYNKGGKTQRRSDRKK